MIYMKHEKHGNHIVYSETHALECEKAGWVRVPFPSVKKDPVVEESVSEEPIQEVRRRGRPRKAE